MFTDESSHLVEHSSNPVITFDTSELWMSCV